MSSGAGEWRQPDRVIGYGRQTIEEADIDAVTSVLRGDWLTQGPSVRGLEAALEEATGSEHAVEQALEHVRLNVAWAEQDVGNISSFLDSYFNS